MKLLGAAKANLSGAFGAPSAHAAWLGLPGESAIEYRFGGYRIVAGLFGGVCRYLIVRKTSGKPLGTAEVRGILALVAPWSSWAVTEETEEPAVASGSRSRTSRPAAREVRRLHFVLAIKDAKGAGTGECLGWHTRSEPYLCLYLPAGDPPVLPDPEGLDARM